MAVAYSPPKARSVDPIELFGLPRGPDSEEWRWIPGFEGRYEVSNLGRILSHRAGSRRVLKSRKSTPYGHQKVILGAAREEAWVHRLVLRAFIGEPEDGQIARHMDGNPGNNSLSNLTWGTPAENNADMMRHGRTSRGERSAQSKLTEGQVAAIRQMLGPARVVAEMYGISQTTVYSIWKRCTWGHVA